MESPSLTISCDECVMQGTHVCEDCVVSFLLSDGSEGTDGALVIDAEEHRAVRLLSGAGLTPGLRHTRRAG
jgi:hypothetical protein